MAPADEANDDLQLSVRLSTTSDENFKITVSNRDFNSSRTFLRWVSPFDTQALDLRILKLKDATSGHDLPGAGLELNRKLRPSRDDLVVVSAGDEVSQEVELIELKAFQLPADWRKVQVAATGAWKAVWKKGLD